MVALAQQLMPTARSGRSELADPGGDLLIWLLIHDQCIYITALYDLHDHIMHDHYIYITRTSLHLNTTLTQK